MSKRKRTSGKKRSRKRRRRHRRKFVSMRAPSGLPITNIVKQRYCQHIQLLGQGLSNIQYHSFRPNSVYDPDHSGVGGQPMGFDEMAGLYNNYRVLGSKITVKWAGYNAGGGEDYVVGCFLDDNAAINYTTWEGVREARKGSSRLITHQRNAVTTSAKYSAKKFWSVKDVKDNENLGAAVGANPSADCYFLVWFQRLDKAVSSATINCMVQIDYIVQYFEPKEIARS